MTSVEESWRNLYHIYRSYKEVFRTAPILGKIYIPEEYFDSLYVTLEDTRFIIGTKPLLPSYIVREDGTHVHVVYRQVCSTVLHIVNIPVQEYSIVHGVLQKR